MLQLRPFVHAAGFLPLVAATSFAQVPEVVHTLRWTEVQAGNAAPVASPNGMIEPGEAMMLSLSISFTPAIGTPVAFGGGTAPLAGYRASAFDLRAVSTLGGEWSHFNTSPGFQFDLFGVPPLPDASLRLGVLQTWHPQPWTPDPSNPIEDVWQAVWTPPTYTQRTVRFLMADIPAIPGPPPPTSNMYVFDGANYVMTPATAILDSVEFPVVPAPGAVSLVAGGALFAGRRRRR